MPKFAAAALAGLAATHALAAQEARVPPRPDAALAASAVPDAVDTPWPGGTITLDIDASDVTRGVYRVEQTIPVAPGTQRLTLLHPEWLPGNHAPRGPIAEIADLRFTANGTPVAWRRDPVEVHAFHLELPPGTREIVARFVHTSPLRPSHGRVTMTPDMLNLQWEKMSLYPAGHYVRNIRVKPRVTVPDGWRAATALDGKRESGNRVSWAETDYETLVDSPIFAGAWLLRQDLGRSVGMSVVADAPGLLRIQPENIATLSALVEEAEATFGRPPYDRYEFLVALSDRLGGIGLEHLRSSENQLEPRNFIDWAGHDWDRNVLAHELAHAWNGKYRRPAGLATPDYRTPMRDDLLWVYEGQTQFWGWVHAVRSGLQSKDMVLGMIARAAGYLAEQPGRDWRPVSDTTFDPIVAARKPRPYRSLSRGEDYYNEGALIWLEADQVIRKGTGGQRGLDDFARAFFAHPGDASTISPFTFNDVVAALNGVYRHDWARFLRERIERPGRPAPVAGIVAAGYRLVWKDRPNPYVLARMEHSGTLDLRHSLGLSVEKDGKVTGALWGGPAFEAGLVTGARIVAVDSYAFSQGRLQQAIARAQGDRNPIALIVRRNDRFETIEIAYSGGLRWPWLEREPGRSQAPLDRLLAPRRENATP